MNTQTNQNTTASTPMSRTARAMIWSILYQEKITYYFQRYLAMAVGVIALMWLTGLITLATAFWSLFYGGLVLSGCLWFLIDKRRVWLLSIKDPALKNLAYRSMLAYIAAKGHRSYPVRPEVREPNDEEKCTTC
jgi:hypothetical protein